MRNRGLARKLGPAINFTVAKLAAMAAVVDELLRTGCRFAAALLAFLLVLAAALRIVLAGALANTVLVLVVLLPFAAGLAVLATTFVAKRTDVHGISTCPRFLCRHIPSQRGSDVVVVKGCRN